MGRLGGVYASKHDRSSARPRRSATAATARYVTKAFPTKKVVVLEGRENIGVTWDLFRYLGIRSDSDLHTFGYEFKPWRHRSAIADAPLIRDYLREAVEENDLGRRIRFSTASHRRTGRAKKQRGRCRWKRPTSAAGPSVPGP